MYANYAKTVFSLKLEVVQDTRTVVLAKPGLGSSFSFTQISAALVAHTELLILCSLWCRRRVCFLYWDPPVLLDQN